MHECKNLYYNLGYETNAISFQMAFLAGRVDRISVRYADLVGSRMDGRNAFIGFQILGGWKASRTARGTTEWSMTAWRCRS